MALTMRQQCDKRHNVRQGGRLIGYVMNIGPNATLSPGWRFIANRKDVAARVPSPATVHGTAAACFASIVEILK